MTLSKAMMMARMRQRPVVQSTRNALSFLSMSGFTRHASPPANVAASPGSRSICSAVTAWLPLSRNSGQATRSPALPLTVPSATLMRDGGSVGGTGGVGDTTGGSVGKPRTEA